MKSNHLYFLFIILLIGLNSCKKKKAENGLVGSWKINSAKTATTDGSTYGLQSQTNCYEDISYEGSLLIDENGNGHISVYANQCDTAYIIIDQQIKNLTITEHENNVNFLESKRRHSYKGFLNDNIFMRCSGFGDKVISTKTRTIELSLSDENNVSLIPTSVLILDRE